MSHARFGSWVRKPFALLSLAAFILLASSRISNAQPCQDPCPLTQPYLSNAQSFPDPCPLTSPYPGWHYYRSYPTYEAADCAARDLEAQGCQTKIKPSGKCCYKLYYRKVHDLH